VPRDEKPGFLQQLLIPDRPWQYIIVDFKKCLPVKAILVRATITAKQLVPLFLTYVVGHVGLPDSITSDRGP
jgi:hypothetical protein